MANIRSNIVGTVANAFSIGKSGPTIRQGSEDPNVALPAGTAGDLYVRVGTTPRLYQFRLGSWLEATDPWVRTVVSTSSYTIQADDHYIGCRYTGGILTLTLPTGVANKRYTIKDELGTSSTNLIRIYAANGQTIDGAASTAINVNYSSISLIYGAEWHII